MSPRFVRASATGVTVQLTSVETPLGRVWIGAVDAGVRVVTVPSSSREACIQMLARAAPIDSIRDGGEMAEAMAAEIARYFAGELRRFTVPLDLQGTNFQRRVWAEVATVPYGETATYHEIAERIGAPRAMRAAGAANGANPAAIVIPCHRLIGSDGTLRGYGGGLAMKRALLDLEQSVIDRTFRDSLE